MSDLLTAIGLMSGSSLSGVTAALLRTDGEKVVELGEAKHYPFDRDLKIWLRRAIKAAAERRDGAAEIGKASGELTIAHINAVEDFLDHTRLRRENVDVLGFHGHTIFRAPAFGPDSLARFWQIGDGAHLASETKIDVVEEFRAADTRAGGVGGPLSSTFFSALIASAPEPPDGAVAIIDIGRNTMITYVPHDARGTDLLSFDCGPGAGLIDEWMQQKTGDEMDRDGALARTGLIDEEALRMMLLTPFLRRKPPKFIERDFKLDHIAALSPADGSATLTALIAACAEKAARHFPEPVVGWVVCGGGRRNSAIMDYLRETLDEPVLGAEEVNWPGAALDAYCMGYLAVRSLKKLPITYPNTTKAVAPTRCGVYRRAAG